MKSNSRHFGVVIEEVYYCICVEKSLQEMSLHGCTVSWLEILPAVTQTHRLKTGGTVEYPADTASRPDTRYHKGTCSYLPHYMICQFRKLELAGTTSHNRYNS